MDINLIKYAPLFAGLDDQEQSVLASGFVSGQLNDGEALFNAGEQSEALFLLNRGFVKLTTDSGMNLATLGQGSVLGEASSFRNSIQDVSAIASTEIEYWRLSDQKLRDIVLQNPSIGIKLGKNFGSMLAQMEDYLVVRLSDTEELGELPRHTLQAIAARLEGKEFQQGQPLIQGGDMAQGLYLLESGSVSMQDSSNANSPETAGPGSILGALALLTDKPQIQDVVASQDGMAWVLSASDFQALNTEHRALRRSLGRKVKARLAPVDQQKAMERLGEMPIFAELPQPSLEKLTQRMILQHVSAGERVYRVGDGGDALYLIETGEIELTAENASGVIEELARIGTQGFFGEMSLFTGQIRTEDVTATRNTNLWVLYKSDLDTLGMEDSAIRTALNKGLAARLASEESAAEQNFRNFELLADLGAEELAQVVHHLKPTRYRAGEQIVRMSTPGTALYLIEDGEVRVQTFNGGSWLLGPGESFGEQSLLTNQPHNASITAQTDADLWTLSKADFDSLLTQYPGLAISLSRVLSQRLTESSAYAPSTPEFGEAPQPSFGQQTEPFGFGQRAEPSAPQTAPFQSQSFQSAPFPSQESGFGPEAPFANEPEPGIPNPLSPGGVPGAPQSARQRRANAAQHISPRQRMGFGQWFGSLSGFAKLRFALIVLLLLWLFGIALPFMFLSMIQGPGVANGAALPVSVSGSLSSVYSLGSYQVAAQDRDSAMEIALQDRLVSPTPTYTPFPTATPQVSPTPKAIQRILLRDNSVVARAESESQAPKFIRGFVNVAEQARAANAAPVADIAPQPEEAVPAPAIEIGRALDPRLNALGVRIEDARVESGQPYWRIVEARFLNEKESAGKHHLYADVLDEAGNRLVGQNVRVVWAEGQHIGPVEDKPFPELGFNYQMYAAGYAYNIEVEGLPSDRLIGAGLGSIDQRFYGIHTSYEVVFQKVIK